MSEQEKSSGGGGGGGGSMLVVEQTTTSRHKQPFRSNELQESTDLHHKRSKAPVVPSVTEELKNLTEDTNENIHNRERIECESEISSEKHKHGIAKKFSSSTKKRDRSPECITMTSMDVDKKKQMASPPLQPIPAGMQSTLTAASDLKAAEKDAFKKADDDSITEEITELRTPEVAKEHSEWSDDEEAGGLPRSDSRASRVSRMKTCSNVIKKKEISWNDDDYKQNIVFHDFRAKSEALMLDRKASIGPCYLPYQEPSGISICLPKKASRCVNEPSGISINISKGFAGSKSKSNINQFSRCQLEKINSENREPEQANCEVTLVKIVTNIKGKINNLQNKIRNVFNA